MSVFRIQANVPEVFVNGSRDFQLFTLGKPNNPRGM